MNRITASLSAFGTAAVITTGALFFAPSGAPAGSTAPGTKVPVSLVETTGDPLRDGEVTTTVHGVSVVDGQARTGNRVTSSTRASFEASLPDGEYLIKTVIGDRAELSHFDDIDATAPVPAGSQCDPLTDCIWIVVRDGRWSLKIGGSETHATAEFEFARRSPAPTTTVPQTQPPTTTATQVGESASTTPVMQEVRINLADETDGFSPDSPPVAGAVTLVQYTNADGVPFMSAAVTNADGVATHHFRPGVYSIQLIPPAGYTLSYAPLLGPHDPEPSNPLIHTFLVVRNAPRRTTGGTGVGVDSTPTNTPAVTAGTPAATPVETTPAPSPTPEPEPEPAPDPQPTPEPEPEPEPAPAAGCDHSDDPEIQALLWTNDGAIRWLVDGELMTLWPEPGMEPVRVCVDAYHRLTELGIDIDYYTAY